VSNLKLKEVSHSSHLEIYIPLTVSRTEVVCFSVLIPYVVSRLVCAKLNIEEAFEVRVLCLFPSVRLGLKF
jgi:hypothetical protein